MSIPPFKVYVLVLPWAIAKDEIARYRIDSAGLREGSRTAVIAQEFHGCSQLTAAQAIRAIAVRVLAEIKIVGRVHSPGLHEIARTAILAHIRGKEPTTAHRLTRMCRSSLGCNQATCATHTKGGSPVIRTVPLSVPPTVMVLKPRRTS